eukprot:CAMPEP_0114571900 /NCGR_PEP_ID=MMETSP0114-20121206/17983_1 /TAXON_ID=31324 /ORGANISM="Goniomonas sp, Strain m" /LENGTH=80 /DNA_ID=CAMNT_0001759031 /DNA_START=86 /DNA_END=324 /DNA_ORIENTATION=+
MGVYWTLYSHPGGGVGITSTCPLNLTGCVLPMKFATKSSTHSIWSCRNTFFDLITKSARCPANAFFRPPPVAVEYRGYAR